MQATPFTTEFFLNGTCQPMKDSIWNTIHAAACTTKLQADLQW